jgi:hypothetical protein
MAIPEEAMTQDRNRDYHLRRAREEIDQAYRADGWTAVNAHLRLSSLHMQRMREPAPEGDVLADRRLLLA